MGVRNNNLLEKRTEFLILNENIDSKKEFKSFEDCNQKCFIKEPLFFINLHLKNL